ncbi:hypothetical protein C8J57DRAFT_1235068 [Mycena rebaudengoi]|nr:hypothetical protein C8J57DRAFT_1235068 [Mycena rebaudengoi]
MVPLQLSGDGVGSSGRRNIRRSRFAMYNEPKTEFQDLELIYRGFVFVDFGSMQVNSIVEIQPGNLQNMTDEYLLGVDLQQMPKYKMAHGWGQDMEQKKTVAAAWNARDT